MCELPGNDSLKSLHKAKILVVIDIESEMMIKMIRATDKGHWHITLEEDILLEAKNSPFLFMILDEATNSGSAGDDSRKYSAVLT